MAPTDTLAATYGNLRGGIVTFHRWHRESDVLVQALLVLSWAGVMGLLAQMRIPLIPVPFTMQTFGVVLGAVLLGTRNGTLAQGIYIAGGYAGVPWFQNFSAGAAYFWGATAGYLIGFVFASLVVGLAVNALRVRGYWGLVGVMGAGAAVVLSCGWAWLAFGLGLGAHEALLVGVFPFIAGDLAKVFLAAGIAIPFLPPVKQ